MCTGWWFFFYITIDLYIGKFKSFFTPHLHKHTPNTSLFPSPYTFNLFIMVRLIFILTLLWLCTWYSQLSFMVSYKYFFSFLFNLHFPWNKHFSCLCSCSFVCYHLHVLTTNSSQILKHLSKNHFHMFKWIRYFSNFIFLEHVYPAGSVHIYDLGLPASRSMT